MVVSVCGTFTTAGKCDVYGELQDWYVHLFCLECKCVLVFGFKEVKPAASSQPRTDVERQLFWLQPFSFLLPVFIAEQPTSAFLKKPAPFNSLLSAAGFVFSFVVIHIAVAWVGFRLALLLQLLILHDEMNC